jgi:predicted metal-binding membrane protein
MTRWHDGRVGALRMGARYGLHCLGCCWALMGILFAVGVMNLIWVAALMVLVLLEKVAPAGIAISRVAGVVAIAAGIIGLTAGG